MSLTGVAYFSNEAPVSGADETDPEKRRAAFRILRRLAFLFLKTYAPETLAPGKPAKRDFVGWSAIGPMVYLLEFAIGPVNDIYFSSLTTTIIPHRT